MSDIILRSAATTDLGLTVDPPKIINDRMATYWFDTTVPVI